MIAAIAGGVGAARMLDALRRVVDADQIVGVVNTGDDVDLHGLRICPDLDTVTYTLAGAVDPVTGWGLVDETWQAMAELRAASEGRLGWFNLGDRDLGTHLYRTTRLHEGAPLSAVIAELCRRWGVEVRLLPMTDDRVETRVTLADGGEIGFQEYFVGLAHAVVVSSVRFAGIEGATPAPGVLDAIAGAERIILCPSNPVVSIGPALAVPGLGAAVAARRDDVVAVSPIIAGRTVKGPADRLLAELGEEASVVGVARRWAPFAATLVVDTADAGLAGAVEEEGMRCVVAPTVMSGPDESAALAGVVLAGLGGRR